MSELKQQPIEGSTQEELIINRLALLDNFSQRPEDDGAWEAVYDMARTASDKDDNENGIAHDISAEELIQLAQTVRSTPQAQRYDLMVDRASNGKLWFDVLETFRSPPLDEAKKQFFASWVEGTNPPKKFQRALDLGTGTGKSLDALETNADQVVGVDQNDELLKVARQHCGKNTELIKAEVDSMPFEDSSFDLATSSGLTGSLDKNTLMGFYHEIARILKPWGNYVEVSPLALDGQINEQDKRITASAKGVLADMIVDTVSGKHTVSDFLSTSEFEDLMTSLGLTVEQLIIPSGDQSSNWLVTIFTKSD